MDSNDQIWALPYFTREGQPAISLIDQKMQNLQNFYQPAFYSVKRIYAVLCESDVVLRKTNALYVVLYRLVRKPKKQQTP